MPSDLLSLPDDVLRHREPLTRRRRRRCAIGVPVAPRRVSRVGRKPEPERFNTATACSSPTPAPRRCGDVLRGSDRRGASRWARRGACPRRKCRPKSAAHRDRPPADWCIAASTSELRGGPGADDGLRTCARMRPRPEPGGHRRRRSVVAFRAGRATRGPGPLFPLATRLAAPAGRAPVHVDRRSHQGLRRIETPGWVGRGARPGRRSTCAIATRPGKGTGDAPETGVAKKRALGVVFARRGFPLCE